MAKKRTEEDKTESSVGTEEPAADESTSSKRNVEDRLDDVANRFSRAMSEGVKRMEGAFEKGIKSVRENPELSRARIKGFFGSSTGGGILVIVGFVWLLYVIGLFNHWFFPVALMVLGIYVLYRNRKD